MLMTSPFIVNTNWLHQRMDQPALSIVDASWYLPAMERDPKTEFERQHIPGAVFFEIDGITKPGSPLPHTIAPPDVFAEKVEALGISDQDTIVIYDGMGLFSAARVWWNFRVMGAKQVFILNGGLPQWLADGLPIETGQSRAKTVKFNADYDPSSVVSFDSMKNIVAAGERQIADARPADRFTGETAEPRKGMRSGHMPGATSVPASSLFEDGKLHSPEKLKSIFQAAGIDLDAPVTTTCGSGVTAAIISLALQSIGHQDNTLYDGSWSEWGGRDDTDIVTGS